MPKRMVSYVCAKCGFKTTKKSNYDRHLIKQFSCAEAPYKCKKCPRPFFSQSALYRHQKTCMGPEQTSDEKDKQIESLKNALAASAGLNAEIKAKQQVVNQTTNNNITINDVKNVTQNIVILHCGNENIDHLKRLPFEELKEKIGFNTDPQTHIEAFKMIRLDEEHPENNNLLLTDRDSDKVLFVADDNGWQEGDYTYQIRNAIYDTNKSLQSLIPYKQRESSDYYWNHLVRGIGGACNERNDAVLKPILEGMREPLHQATLRLMNIQPVEDMDRSGTDSSVAANIELAVVIEKEKTLREQEKTLREKEKTRQLELQVELARLQSVKA